MLEKPMYTMYESEHKLSFSPVVDFIFILVLSCPCPENKALNYIVCCGPMLFECCMVYNIAMYVTNA